MHFELERAHVNAEEYYNKVFNIILNTQNLLKTTTKGNSRLYAITLDIYTFVVMNMMSDLELTAAQKDELLKESLKKQVVTSASVLREYVNSRNYKSLWVNVSENLNSINDNNDFIETSRNISNLRANFPRSLSHLFIPIDMSIELEFDQSYNP